MVPALCLLARFEPLPFSLPGALKYFKKTPTLVGHRALPGELTKAAPPSAATGRLSAVPWGRARSHGVYRNSPHLATARTNPPNQPPGTEPAGFCRRKSPKARWPPRQKRHQRLGCQPSSPQDFRGQPIASQRKRARDGAHLSPRTPQPRLAAPPRAAGRRSTHVALRPPTPPGTRAPVYNGSSETQPPDPQQPGEQQPAPERFKAASCFELGLGGSSRCSASCCPSLACAGAVAHGNQAPLYRETSPRTSSRRDFSFRRYRGFFVCVTPRSLLFPRFG